MRVSILSTRGVGPFILSITILVAATPNQEHLTDSLAGEPYRRISGARAFIDFTAEDSLVAAAVLGFLDGQAALPGLPDSVPGAVRAVLAHSLEAFDEVTGSVIPEWSAGVAIPRLSTLVVTTAKGSRLLDSEGRRTLRHEWAHLGLADALEGLRAPRWFDEGYAQWASGGFDAMEIWKLRLLLALGKAPSMDSLTLRWPSGRAEAEVAYLLSASAVTYLLGESGDRGLRIFLDRWREDEIFEPAFRSVFGLTTSQFEEDWKKHVKDRYGWLFVLSHSAIFWMVLALILLLVVQVRRTRNREKMARLRARELPEQPAYWIQVIGGDTSDEDSYESR